MAEPQTSGITSLVSLLALSSAGDVTAKPQTMGATSLVSSEGAVIAEPQTSGTASSAFLASRTGAAIAIMIGVARRTEATLEKYMISNVSDEWGGRNLVQFCKVKRDWNITSACGFVIKSSREA
ncbi:hypothetical protein F5Y07DRAFT_352936 [Xylaria sp. FL0933]|nr:hypothetical protein F5Y07DRAFT_352936 [Xylaria sp. FL0933]